MDRKTIKKMDGWMDRNIRWMVRKKGSSEG